MGKENFLSFDQGLEIRESQWVKYVITNHWLTVGSILKTMPNPHTSGCSGSIRYFIQLAIVKGMGEQEGEENKENYTLCNCYGYRRDARMTVSFKEELFDEDPTILESEVKPALKATERNKSSRIEEMPLKIETES